MKTAQQIIGLPVVSIFDGNEIGKVKNVIVNASKGTIDFFVIDSGIRSLSGGVIPADRVLGIGEYALTIQTPDDISDIVKIPAAIELMQKNITVRGTRVLTRKGSLLGQTGDFYVNDEETYNITGVEFIPANSDTSSGIIPRSSIITFGKDLLVVQDDFIEKLIKSPSAIEHYQEVEKKNNALVDTVASESEELSILDNIIPDDTELAQPDDNILPETLQSEVQDTKDHELSAAELFEQRQRQYLLGKKVTKTIYGLSGQVIVQEGETITDQIIEAAKENGKLIELVMNYEG